VLLFAYCTYWQVHRAGGIVGHICHGGSVAISAGILKGVKSS
jgi:putative intracellular protease/amidase